MTIEAWKSFFEYGGVILLFLTFVFGAGAVIAANRINRAQARELRDFQLRIEGEQQKTAEAQKEAAQAQLALSQSLFAFARRAGDRVLDSGKFIDGLKDKPKRTVEIWCRPDDTEAERFSEDILRAVMSVGWPASVRVFNLNDVLGKMSLGKVAGITVFSRDAADQRVFTPLLLQGLRFGGQAVGTTAPELAKDTIVVVVGTRDKL
jgi:hypothetical protein